MKENYGKAGSGVEIGMNDAIEKELKESYKKEHPSSSSEHIQLPSQIKFIEKEGKIEMLLMEEAFGKGEKNENMQEHSAAFEGWAVILKRYLGKDIKLDIAFSLNLEELNGEFEGNGHYKRFLYRVLRFEEQYSKWFSLSENLNTFLFSEGGFCEWLKKNGKDFTNNVPLKEKAVPSNDKISENWVEGTLAGQESILQDLIKKENSERNEIFCQHPVGLFSHEVTAKNEVFARGNAAVDLWTWDGDKFYAFELKYKNKMVGIITELFFYANYLYDLLIKKNFKLNEKRTKKRGYCNLLGNEFKEICAYMLVDEMHPLIDEKVLEILNDSKSTSDIKILYKMQKYKMVNGSVSLD